MNPKYDASKLLYAKSENNRFLHKLNISDEDEALLLDARRKARKAIRIAFHEARQILLKSFDDYQNANSKFVDISKDKKEFAGITPAFWSQGSYSYRTMNNPAYTPPQQFDLDDGVYLPTDMFEDKPIYSKDLFISIVDEALEKLAREEGWGFDNAKVTCSRIVISENMHLDFPMYAIPRERFEELKNTKQIVLESASGSFEFSQDHIELDSNSIYLAVRNQEHWIKSDPKRIEEWFKKEIKLHGLRLRRVCRYLKAWRDHTWKDGGPSSIVLMVCAVNVFNENTPFNRDCEALLAIAKRLPDLFSNDIVNPAVPEDNEEMFQSRHSEEDIKDIIEKSHTFEQSLRNGLVYASSTQDVVDEFIILFGDRIPNQCQWVSQLTTAPSGKAKKQVAPVLPANIESGFNIETG